MAQGAEQLAQQLGPAAEPSLVLGLTPNQQLFGSLGKWAKVTPPNEDIMPLKPRGPLGVVPRSWL